MPNNNIEYRSFFKKEFTPFLYEWDQIYAKHYLYYNTQIKKLKKGRLREIFHQRTALKIMLLKKMRIIGDVFPVEFSIYKNADKNIVSNYNRSFHYFQILPLPGLIFTSIIFPYSIFKNYSKNILLATFAPIILNLIYNEVEVGPTLKTLEFLNWVLEFRKAKAKLEYDGLLMYQKAPRKFHRFRHNTRNALSVNEIYQKVIDFAKQES